MAEPFEGKINVDIRDSTPDWGPFLAKSAGGRRARIGDHIVGIEFTKEGACEHRESIVAAEALHR